MERLFKVLGMFVVGCCAAGGTAFAQEETSYEVSNLLADVDALWTCLAAFLVFFMQAGFGLVEAGLTRAKNACNILMKNLADFSIGTISFWAIGFGLMFGATSGWFGTNAFFFSPEAAVEEGVSYAAKADVTPAFGWSFLLFQTVFCATAATIVSGCLAERTKFGAYLIASVVITALIYPIFGSWCWSSLLSLGGEGWLETKGFLDFAGSTVVHSVGGWAGLAGAIVVGSRLGKYSKGRVNPIPGHSLPLAALGVFILWLGWFGFNPGSTTAVQGGSFAMIAANTNIAAAGGAVGAALLSWFLFKKPDASLAFNGALAGLVAITAGCDIMTPGFSLLTGALGGVLVVFSVLFFDKIRIDDPVGAISVHGVCGAWGTLAIGLWGTGVGVFTGGGTAQLGIQALGVAAAFAWTFPTAFVLFYAIKVTIGLRASAEDELEGLDLAEHGMEAYPGLAKELGREPTGAGKIAPDALKGLVPKAVPGAATS